MPSHVETSLSMSYEVAADLALIAERQVRGIVLKALAALGSPELVRGRLDEQRVKPRQSVERKAKQKKWSAQEMFERCEDFLGMRMVCNNLQDVHRAADLIHQSFEGQGLEVERRDYIAKPLAGYRAIHILTRYPVTAGKHSLMVGCEVQIRTFLQDAWARLSRQDLYRSSIPRELIKQFEAMSNSLAEADALAEGVRLEITKPVKGQKPSVDAQVTDTSLAFIYQRAFKEEPPSYLVEWMLKKISDASVRADALDALLQDGAFLTACEAEYQKAARWPADASRKIEWAIEALLQSKSKAIDMARLHGQRDWEDVVVQSDSEIRAAIPGSWANFEEQLEDQSIDIREIARYFEVASECICGEELIEFDDFINAVQEHYGLRGDEAHESYDLLLTALNDSGVEDSDGLRFCSRCNHKMDKDD